MARQWKVLWLPVLLMAVPTLLLAQSKDFPDDQDDCACGPNCANVKGAVASGTVNMQLVVKGPGRNLPAVRTQELLPPGIPVSACNPGKFVAEISVDKVCSAAVGEGFSCLGSSPAFVVPVTNPFGACDCIPANWPDCADAGPDAALTLTCTSGGPTSGFIIFRGSGWLKFEVSPVGPASKIVALNDQTTAGNTIGTDMGPQYLVSVLPNGVLGLVNFEVFYLQQGQQRSQPFSVNVTPSLAADPIALHNAIASGFNGLVGLGLTAIVHHYGFQAREVSPVFRALPGIAGAFVHIPNAGAKVTQINVTGAWDASQQKGMDIEAETGAPGLVEEVPTLNPLGLALLVGILLLSGLWLLRRRQRLSQA